MHNATLRPPTKETVMIELGIEEQIQAKGLNAPRVHPETIERLKARIEFKQVVPEGTPSTLIHAFLDGRFFLSLGHSACVSPENFDPAIGHSIAMTKARQAAEDKLWELEGYRLYQNGLDTPKAPDEAYPEPERVQAGMQVHYFEQVAHKTSDPMIATVASVYDQSMVALTVHAPNGTVHARDKVEFLKGNESPTRDLVAYARFKN